MSDGERLRPYLFVLLTFLISWGSLGVLFPVGPALAAMYLAWRDGRVRGVRELLAPLLRWRVDGSLYVIVLAGPLVGGAGVYATWRILGLGAAPVDWAMLLLSPLLIVAFGLIAAFEEIGWRGYLLPALDSRMPARRAALFVGVAWGAWHVPLLFAGGALNDRLPLFAYPAITIPGSFIYSWLYHRAKGSLFVVTLLHGAQQAFVLPVIWNVYRAHQDMSSFFSIAIALVWIVGGTLALLQPRLGLVERPDDRAVTNVRAT